MQEIKAPHPYTLDRPSVFLAGSIEMGRAENWQRVVVENLKDFDIVILNPRRDDWDESWIQSVQNPEFRKQVEWELEGLEKADYILMNFIPGTISPISLLEFGLFHHKKIFVVCPDKFWREANIEMVCERYKIPLFHTLNDAIDRLKQELKK